MLPGSEERTELVGIPSVSIQDSQLRIGDVDTSSIRSYTFLKVIGTGAFSSLCLCEWHSTLPPDLDLPAMQCGPRVRPEWKDKRLVVIKQFHRKWLGGWAECQKAREIKVLRALPLHPNIIPLYDAFLHSSSQTLYLVLEPMEGNLYQLFKSRKGRLFAGVLVASIFHQIVSALSHLHDNGYFHRDMKPENVLVTTTGLFDYTTVSPVASPDAPKEKDLVVTIKLADFGLARETNSNPPYTEYVNTRWYRAPEILLLDRVYSSAVDMWGLGVIMFAKICAVLGDPSDEYGIDSSGIAIGGGPWPSGITLANTAGFQFSKSVPQEFTSLFESRVPTSLLVNIRGLLRYDPQRRLTSRECLESPFLREMEVHFTQ